MLNRLNEQDLAAIRNHQTSAPVDVIAIARDLNINVYRSTAETLSGKIVKSSSYGGASGYAIFVNSNHPKVRQRFTVAHEIAHFLLHKKEIGDGIVDDALYRSGLSNALEAEANKLAADILMPWYLLYKAMDENIKSIADLAAIFHVSESAMSIRLGVPN